MRRNKHSQAPIKWDLDGDGFVSAEEEALGRRLEKAGQGDPTIQEVRGVFYHSQSEKAAALGAGTGPVDGASYRAERWYQEKFTNGNCIRFLKTAGDASI